MTALWDQRRPRSTILRRKHGKAILEFVRGTKREGRYGYERPPTVSRAVRGATFLAPICARKNR